MTRLIRWLRHWFCRAVTWRYPTLAEFDRDEFHRYPLTCVECGHSETVTGPQLRMALEAPEPSTVLDDAGEWATSNEYEDG